MQIKIVRIFLSSLALCLTVGIAEAGTVNIRFIGIDTTRSDLYVKQGAEFEEVMVPLYERSASYHVETEGNLMQLYTKTETEKGPLFEIAVEGKLPSGAESALGIYLMSSNGSPRLYFYSDDWSDFPMRSYRLINISPVVISSKIDETLIRVQPLQSEIVKASLSSNNRYVIVMTVYKDGEEEWQPIFDRRVSLHSDWRSTGIVVLTDGTLQETMNRDYKVDRSKPVQMKMSHFGFTEDAYTSAQRAAQRQQAE